MVLDRGRTHDELGALDVHRRGSQVAVVLCPGVVEVGEVAAVVDDSLRVRVREPDAGERGVLERRPAVGDAAELERVADAGMSGADELEDLVTLLLHHLHRQRLEVQAEERLVFEGRTLKCQSSKSTEIPSRCEIRPPSAA